MGRRVEALFSNRHSSEMMRKTQKTRGENKAEIPREASFQPEDPGKSRDHLSLSGL